jgi:heme/copper-type cytochrome/quinol oxidase subunit 3
VNESSDPLQNAIAQATSYVPRTLDNRLTVLSARMLYISGSFFFASFYFGLVYLQIVNENNMWLPHGVDHPPTWIGVSQMALVLIAGLAYFWGQWFGLYRQKLSNLTIGLWIAAVLTVISVVIHIIELHKPGFSLQSGGYVSLFITIEGVFTFVLAATALVLIGFAIRASRGLFTGGAGAGVEAFGEWYGWISAIALFNFLALYVQPFFPIA